MHHSAMGFKGSATYPFKAKAFILKAPAHIAEAACCFTELHIWVAHAKREASKAQRCGNMTRKPRNIHCALNFKGMGGVRERQACQPQTAHC